MQFLKNKFAIVFALTLAISLIINLVSRLKPNDFITIAGLTIAIAGLFIAMWQAWLTIENSANDKMSREIDDLRQTIHNDINDLKLAIINFRGEVNAKDDTHDQQIIKLLATDQALSSQLEFQTVFFSKQTNLLIDKVSTLAATMATLTKLGELNLKMTRSESTVKRLMDTVETLESKILASLNHEDIS